MESLEERLGLSYVNVCYVMLCYVCLPGSLIIIVSGYLELILDELGLKRVELIV